MISSTLRIVLIIGVIIYFVMILMFLKNKALALKYTLLWLVAYGFGSDGHFTGVTYLFCESLRNCQ